MARRMVDTMGRRIFRRPLSDSERERLLVLFQLGSARGGEYAFEEGMKASFSALLTSPSFLFRGEIQPNPDNPAGNHLIDEWSLATRLSYFLWSSTPDEELLNHAAAGTLRKNLDAEVTRMLAHGRAESLVTNFAGQWLQLRDLANINPSRRFRDFNGGVAQSMRRESDALFRHILREDLPVTELITADYTFLNQRLAKFYGISGVKGDNFRKVSLKGNRPGGVLSHGSILTITSNPTRTSPVKRGKWILENILGSPPPEAPPNVPDLEETAERTGGTLRQQLEIHRSDPNCAACHELMDPIGLAFENYNAVGQWRDNERGEPIDASGQLVTGERFKNADELTRILLDSRQEQFVRCMSERMLTYALGRGVEFYDNCALDQIMSELKSNEMKFSAMVRAIIRSVPFQYRRGEGEREYD